MAAERELKIDPELFVRGVHDIVTREELSSLLSRRKKLRIKHGVDATASGLHVGNAASLWKIRALQEQGHCAVVLLGDVTSAIGDPTGRSRSRPVLEKRLIEANAHRIEKEMRQILLGGRGLLEIHRSSEWYEKMNVPTFLSLLARVSHARLIARDMFARRQRAHEEIFMHELVYPVLQGYDSVALRADLTVIGSDQLFNEHMGRFFQEKMGQPPQVIVTLNILPGLDGGEKMSKSLGNAILLSDTPPDKFGKAMRLLDSLIIPYLTVYTDVPLEKIKRWERHLAAGKNPMHAKLFFAEALVRRYHGAAAAEKERERFSAVFSRRETPTDIPDVHLKKPAATMVELLSMAGLASSKSEARRLIGQGAVEFDNEAVRDPHRPPPRAGSFLLKVGKRKLVRLTLG